MPTPTPIGVSPSPPLNERSMAQRSCRAIAESTAFSTWRSRLTGKLKMASTASPISLLTMPSHCHTALAALFVEARKKPHDLRSVEEFRRCRIATNVSENDRYRHLDLAAFHDAREHRFTEIAKIRVHAAGSKTKNPQRDRQRPVNRDGQTELLQTSLAKNCTPHVHLAFRSSMAIRSFMVIGEGTT